MTRPPLPPLTVPLPELPTATFVERLAILAARMDDSGLSNTVAALREAARRLAEGI